VVAVNVSDRRRCVLALMCDVRVALTPGEDRLERGAARHRLRAVIEPLRARCGRALLRSVRGRLLRRRGAVARLLHAWCRPASSRRSAGAGRALAKAPLAFAQVKQALLRPVLEAVTRNAQAERRRAGSWFGRGAAAAAETVERLKR